MNRKWMKLARSALALIVAWQAVSVWLGPELAAAAPTLVNVAPAVGSSNVNTATNLMATFSESVKKVPGHSIEICTTASTDCQYVDSGDALGTGTTWNIDIPVDLRGVTSYRAVAEAGAFADLNDNSAPAIEWTFTTTATVPDAPEITGVIPGDGMVTVIFNSPYNGGSDIYSYDITIHPISGGVNYEDTITGTFYTLTGLTNGVTYEIMVTATNDVGMSAPSANKTFVPSTVPSAPTITGVVVGNRSATVSFDPSASDGFNPITEYEVLAKQGGVLIRGGTGSTSPITVTGLTNGQTYSFTVEAVNAIGNSAPSAALLGTPVSIPAAPTNVSAEGGNGQATVSFTPSASDGGSPITGYRVTTIPGDSAEAPISVSVGADATSAVVTGLRNGGYYQFKVVALNALGTSAEAQTLVWTRVGTVPAKPFNLSALAGDGKATVSFDEPDSGGSAITSYKVTSWVGADAVAQVQGASSPIEVVGLQNGTVYTFTVEAYNDFGWSPQSDPSNTVTPATVPGTPTYTIGTLSDQTLTALSENYSSRSQETKTITVTRTGTGDLTNVAVALSGTNVGSFTLTQPAATTLDGTTPSTTFTMKAKDGLTAGTYTATVTISADNMTPVTFTVTQVVNGVGTGGNTGSGGSGGAGSGGGGNAGSAPAPGPETTSGGELQVIVDPQQGGSGEEKGVVRLNVPSGAVSKDGEITITIVAPDQAPPTDALQAVSPVVEFASSNGHTFDKHVEMTFHYDKAKIGNDRTAAVYYYNEQQHRWMFIGGKVNADGTVTVSVNHFTKFAVFAYKPVSFVDMAGHWATAYTDRLVGMKVIQGYPDRTLRPDEAVTRAQFAKMLAEALGLPAPASVSDFADDSEIPSWSKSAVAAAVKAGLVSGYPEQGAVRFKADRTISRAEMAVMIARALSADKNAAGGGTDRFKDAAAIPEWARASVEAAVSAGILSGYVDGTFRPDHQATRAEAAAMIYKLLEVLHI